MYAHNKIIRVAAGAVLISSALVLATQAPSMAQRVNKNALEKTKFYESPREIQIIDDRPVVRDFREAPQDAGSIDLPPGPQGSGGGAGGSGAGALGGGPGSSIPPGGLPLGNNQGYRTPNGGSLPLPKSGFGRETNIPARGMAPRSALPSGSTNNQLMGKMLNPGTAHGVGGGAPRGMQPTIARTNGNSNAPAAATYSGGYGQGSGNGYGGSASRTDAQVRGFLLNKHN